MAVSHRESRANIHSYTLENGRTVYILAEGRLVKLAACDGHPAEIMDMSFAIQALSLRYLLENRDRLGRERGKMLHTVPEEIDRAVALLKLSSCGVSIDDLTPAQRKYLFG